MKTRVLLALVVLVLGFAVTRSWTQYRQYRRTEAICTATGAKDWSTAVRLSEGFSGRTQLERLATECRCEALLNLGNPAQCTEDLRRRWQQPRHAEWLPSEAVTALVVEGLRQANDLRGAADLAQRGHRAYPADSTLALFELALRSQIEDEEEVLRDLMGRLTAESPPQLRLALAQAYKDRHQWSAILALTEPLPDGPNRNEMLDLRAHALGMEGRVPELRDLYGIGEDWRQAPIEAIASYGKLLSRLNIKDPKAFGPDLLFFAADHSDRFENHELLEEVFVILMQYLVLEEDPDRLEAVYAQAVTALGDFERLKPEELERLAILADPNAGAIESNVTLELIGNRAGDYLLVSPPPPAPTSVPLVRYPIPADGRLELQQPLGAHPVRWVWRDAHNALCGSAAIWPLPGRPLLSTRERPTNCRPAPPAFSPKLPPGDGRLRAFVVLLDSAEWRLVRYLQARAELPTLSFMEASGVSGPIDSNPPFTAAALRTILFPRSRGESSVLSFMHSLGREVEGLNFIGANPLDSLRWFLPQEEDLLEALGGGNLRVASLLRSFGSLEGGREAEIVGPGGRHELLGGFSGHRSLREDERREFFEHTTMNPTAQGLLREMAADFDTLDHLAEGQEVDLVLLRVASLDVMTHTFLLVTNRPEQDADSDFLLSAYRYADRRLGELYSRLDRDDVLIVLSDHGAKTALQHERSAIFFAAGDWVPHQELIGDPSLRGLGRLLSDLWTLDLDLPATGLEAWLPDPPPVAVSE